jgi:hypothetical protein
VYRIRIAPVDSDENVYNSARKCGWAESIEISNLNNVMDVPDFPWNSIRYTLSKLGYMDCGINYVQSIDVSGAWGAKSSKRLRPWVVI